MDLALGALAIVVILVIYGWAKGKWGDPDDDDL